VLTSSGRAVVLLAVALVAAAALGFAWPTLRSRPGAAVAGNPAPPPGHAPAAPAPAAAPWLSTRPPARSSSSATASARSHPPA